MSKRIIYSSGDKINNLVYLKDVESGVTKYGKYRKAMFKCMCGNEFVAKIGNVKRGSTSSCGCIAIQKLKERSTKHGIKKHPLYYIYHDIKKRCYDPQDKSYKYYGEKGIKMCEEWSNDILDFYLWGISNGYKKGLEIDRIDGNGNYSPKNCRFVTSKENQRNRSNNHLHTHYGKTQCLSSWAEELNVTRSYLVYRLNLGWDIEKIKQKHA